MTIYKKFVVFVLSLVTIFSLAGVAWAADTLDVEDYINGLYQTYPELTACPYYAFYYKPPGNKYYPDGDISVVFTKTQGECSLSDDGSRYYLTYDFGYFYRKMGTDEASFSQLDSDMIGIELYNNKMGGNLIANYDIKLQGSGGEVVFPQVAPPTYQDQAGEIIQEEMTGALSTLLPVGLAILATLLLVLLIRRLIKSFL